VKALKLQHLLCSSNISFISQKACIHSSKKKKHKKVSKSYRKRKDLPDWKTYVPLLSSSKSESESPCQKMKSLWENNVEYCGWRTCWGWQRVGGREYEEDEIVREWYNARFRSKDGRMTLGH